jgi:L-alanine-DL-glutamate epimerase-like enolase superfamily enzyme
MQISSGVRTLTLQETFTIARGSTDSEQVVWAEIRHGGHVGRGEGAPDDRYGEAVAAARAYIDAAGEALGDDPFALEAIEARLRARAGSVVGRCAVECALHDLVGKLVGQPTWRLLGLADHTPETSYTIGIDSVDGTADRARRAAEAGYRRLKIKLGGEGDLERLHAIRAVCDLPLRVDANEGWGLDEARRLLPVLVDLGVELIEQPFPAGERDAFRELRALGSSIPLVVDEGCHTLRDVADVASYADGVNLKLAKTGGIREAVRMVHAARALGLVVMLGCMIESSLGISAAGQLASLCDFVDLDGHLLISDDPTEGLGLEDGRIVLSQRPGLGVEPLP